MDTEIWMTIPGWDFYEASSHGRIRSVDRSVTHENRWGGFHTVNLKGRVLYSYKRGKYYRVRLCDRIQKTLCVHHLVCAAFHGPRPEGLLALHKDDNSDNNTPSNLYWGTFEENIADKWENGGFAKGVATRWGKEMKT